MGPHMHPPPPAQAAPPPLEALPKVLQGKLVPRDLRTGADGEDTTLFCAYARRYYTKEQLRDDSPSRRDGVSYEQEAKMRHAYSTLIIQVGKKLNLPFGTTVAAIDLCHRYYAQRSHLRSSNQFFIACAALLLAGKVTETFKYSKPILQQAWHASCDASSQPVAHRDRLLDERFAADLREHMMSAERDLLYALGFTFPLEDRDIFIDAMYRMNAVYRFDRLPQAIVLARLPREQQMSVLNLAYGFVHCTMHTTLSLQYKGKYLAVLALYLGLQAAGVPQQLEVGGRPWWEIEGATPDILADMVEQVTEVFEAVAPPAAAAVAASPGELHAAVGLPHGSKDGALGATPVAANAEAPLPGQPEATGLDGSAVAPQLLS